MKRIALAVVILLIAAVSFLRYALPARQSFYTDGRTIKEPANTARPRDILWQPPIKLTPSINSRADDYEPRVSGDGNTLFFVRGKAGHNADIYFSSKTFEKCQAAAPCWSEPEPLASIDTEYDELGPERSVDGRSLYFYSDRPGGRGGYDIWVSRRSPDGWATATNLGPSVNSEFNDYGPALSPDGSMLYFASNRPQPDDEHAPDPDAWPATMREDVFRRDYDLYAAAITDRGHEQAHAIDALNSPHNDGAPAVSPFGDFLYFSSDRPNGCGGYDLFRSRIRDGALDPPTNLGPSVNTNANELDPSLSLGGYGLHFSSDRCPAAAGATADAAKRRTDYDVYYTTSREVFGLTENASSEINWAALGSRVGPNLLWALLALLLLLILLTLIRATRYRPLSLLTKCLMVSALAHLLLLLLFNLWEVTTAIARGLPRHGVIQIALTPPGTSGDLADQVRGSLADVDAPDPPALTSPRAASSVEFTTPDRFTELTVARHQTRQFDRSLIDAGDIRTADLTNESAVNLPQTVHALPTSRSQWPVISVPESALRITRQEPTTPTIKTEPSSNPTPRRADALDPAALPKSMTANLAPAPTNRMPTDPSRVPITPPAFAASPPHPLVPVAHRRRWIDDQHTPVFDVALPANGRSRGDATEPTAQMSPRVAHDVRRPALQMQIDMAADDHQPVLKPAPTRPYVPTDSLIDSDTSFRTAQTQPSVAFPGTMTRISLSASPIESFDLHLPPVGASPTRVASSEPAPTVAAVTFDSARFSTADIEADGGRPSTASTVALQPLSQVHDSDALTTGMTFESPAAAQTSVVPKAAPKLRFVPTGEDSLRSLDLKLPIETSPPIDAYAQRDPDIRRDVVKRMGGSDETEAAVKRALQWLARHQDSSGKWDAADFDDHCGRCGGASDFEVDIATTGLSLLCFLAADHTHQGQGPYRDNVRRGLDWLMSIQNDEGGLIRSETMYSHGIATLALSEAYGMTGDPALERSVESAVRFVHGARNTRRGGWRYEPRQSGDTSVLGWQIMALKSARMAGIDIPQSDFDAASDWLDRVSSDSRPGLYAYLPRRRPTPAMTAEGMFVQQLLGRSRDEARMVQSADFVARQVPDWPSHVNTYYWYYATLALFQHQGEHWRRWNQAVTEQLLEHQHRDGPSAGTWDPVGEWAPVGGRVYQTALCTLMLEVYYRYLPLYALEETR